MGNELPGPLPHSLEAERAVLGAALLGATGIAGSALLRAGQFIREGDWFLDQNRRIWRAARQVAAEGKAVDLVTLAEYLHRAGELEAAGGAGYLGSLVDGVPRVSNVEHYAGIVKEKALLRRLVHAAAGLQTSAMHEEGTGAELIEGGVRDLLALLEGSGEARLHEWEEAVAGAMDELLGALERPEGVMRLPFGIPSLDQWTGGLRREELVLIVGGTSHGKSLLGEQLWASTDAGGYLGQVYSAEMSKEALATRALAHRGRFPLWYLRKPEEAIGREWEGMLITREWIRARLLEAASEEMKRRVRVMDRGITPESIWTFSRMQKETQGLDLVLIDYDQLVIREGMRREQKLRDTEYGEQQEFMNRALELTKELKLCFVLLCQPKKVSEEVARGQRSPRVEEIFGSSSVGNTAHNIFWIVRHFFQHDLREKYEDKATCYILKFRNYKPHALKLRFNDELVLFGDAPAELPLAGGEA